MITSSFFRVRSSDWLRDGLVFFGVGGFPAFLPPLSGVEGTLRADSPASRVVFFLYGAMVL